MLIVDMPMPEHCFGCSIKYDPETRMCMLDGHMFEETLGVITNHRDKDCPIKCVLPDEHGDLIDRDELFEAINSRVVFIDSCPEGKPSMKELFERDVLCVCLHDVVCADAVIVAERKDDDKTRSNTPS